MLYFPVNAAKGPVHDPFGCETFRLQDYSQTPL
jgi:hypothetical protein